MEKRALDGDVGHAGFLRKPLGQQSLEPRVAAAFLRAVEPPGLDLVGVTHLAAGLWTGRGRARAVAEEAARAAGLVFVHWKHHETDRTAASRAGEEGLAATMRGRDGDPQRAHATGVERVETDRGLDEDRGRGSVVMDQRDAAPRAGRVGRGPGGVEEVDLHVRGR